MKHRYSVPPAFVLDNLDSLRTARRSKNWETVFVAELLHLAKSTYKHIERAEVLPSKRIYNKLAKLFEWRQWE